MSRAPALFISHGSPMFSVEPGTLGPALKTLGDSLTGLKGIVIVSPHWQTLGPVRVSASTAPETIHDFGGFPEALYALRYPAPGDPALAARITSLLNTTGIPAVEDPTRGLDHGAWVPMRYLKPEADVPVVQVSLPHDATPASAFRLGAALAPLRDDDILVIGSGSLTHNLMEVFRARPDDGAYAQAFADWVTDAVARDDVDALLEYRSRVPDAARAHPTEEHFLTLLVARGAAAGPGRLVHGGMTYGILSMDSFAWDTDSGAHAKQ